MRIAILTLLLGVAATATTAQHPEAVTAAQAKVVATGGKQYGTGWVKDPAAVKRVLNRLQRDGKERTFERAAPLLLRAAADDDPVFYWHAERRVLGSVQPSWDQGSVGSCVGFGYGRAVQDLMLNEIAAGQPERYPGADLAPEVIYGGSRVEIGGGGIDGDGSVGAWAAEFVKKGNYGVVARGRYGELDLTRYSEAVCRRLGVLGIPDDVEAEARKHPVTEVALLTTAEGLWAAIGSGKGVPVCSMQGFAMRRDRDGFCTQNSRWAHCMEYRGRFVHPRRGRSVVVQNSWGDYLGSANNKFEYRAADGAVRTEELPEGCFCVELNVAARALAEGDTFVLAGFTGWDATPPPPAPPVPSNPVAVTVDGVSATLDFVNRRATLPHGWTTNLDPAPATATELLRSEMGARGVDPALIEASVRLILELLARKAPPTMATSQSATLATRSFPPEGWRTVSPGPTVCPPRVEARRRVVPVRRLLGRSR